MKSTKVQTLGADHAIEHLTLLETLDKLMAKTCTHVGLHFTLGMKSTKVQTLGAGHAIVYMK